MNRSKRRKLATAEDRIRKTRAKAAYARMLEMGKQPRMSLFRAYLADGPAQPLDFGFGKRLAEARALVNKANYELKRRRKAFVAAPV